MNLFWFKKINILDVPYVVRKTFLRDVLVNTEELTGLADLVLKVILLGTFHKKLNLVNYQVGNRDSVSLFYKSQFLSKKIIEDLFEDEKFEFNGSSLIYRNYSDYWKKILKSKCAYSALDMIKFINIVEDKISNNPKQNVTICLPSSDLSRPIFNSYKKITKSNFNFKKSINLRFSLKYFLPGVVLHSFLKALKAKIISRKNHIPIKLINKGMILEQYAGPIMMKRYPDYSHLFWHKESNIPPEQIIVYADRKDTYLSHENIKMIEKNGFSFIDFMNLFEHVDKPFKLLIKSLITSLKSFSIKIKNPFWKWLVVYENTIDLELKRYIYRKFNVKAIHQHEEWLPKTIVKSLAINIEGGIFISNMWSITAFPQLWFEFGKSDIAFSWGDYQLGFLKSHNFSSDYYINTGLVCGDNLNPSRLSKIKDSRNNFSTKSKFVIGCFDNSFGSDLSNSFNSFLSFYEEILKFTINNKDCSLLIKPKKTNPFIYFKKNTKIMEYYNQLENENRIHILDSDESISLAAYYSDLTISYGISTAGFISILMDKPNIFLNTNGNKFHPLMYKSSWSRLFVDSVEKLIVAIDEFKSKSFEINHDMKKMIDHYNDGMGNYRSGKFISYYMNAFDRGLNRDDSLNYALNSYKEKWGKNAIKSEISKNNEGLIIWEKSLSDIDNYFSRSK